MSDIEIIIDKCTGCKACVATCPFGAIELNNNKAKILDNCMLCGSCASTCKFGALNFRKDNSKSNCNISDYKGVWVFAEQKNSIPSKVVMELLGEGRKLADKLQVPLSAILLSENCTNAAKTLISYGADIVYTVNNAILRHFNDEVYADIFVQLINQYKPEIVLIGATTYGRSLAPRIASKINTGLTADCTQLEIDTDKRLLLQTRPAFGGNIMATIICPNHRPQMSTVRPNLMKPLEPDYLKTGKIIEPDIKIPDNINTNIKEIVASLSGKISLSDAEVIVAIGRGIGEEKNIKLAEDLAEVLGGAVGASRPLVDNEWISYEHQIGQSGRTVSPKVYFACGISGAIQHIAGMSSSDIIIAINKNPDAPIFKIATFGIVGDILEILPKLTEEFKEKIK